ncbi:MAG: hypothetical protein RSE35_03980, partial [Bacteroidales bacterium]
MKSDLTIPQLLLLISEKNGKSGKDGKDAKIRKAPTNKFVSASLEAWSHLGLNQGLPDYESG